MRTKTCFSLKGRAAIWTQMLSTLNDSGKVSWSVNIFSTCQVFNNLFFMCTSQEQLLVYYLRNKWYEITTLHTPRFLDFLLLFKVDLQSIQSPMAAPKYAGISLTTCCRLSCGYTQGNREDHSLLIIISSSSSQQKNTEEVCFSTASSHRGTLLCN